MNEEISELIHIVIGALVCVALLYMYAMRIERSNFIDDCMSTYSRQVCSEMWDESNE